MNMTPLESSNLAAAGYDNDNRVLRIEFKNGGVYEYPDQPRKLFDDLVMAESAGKFFHANIRPITNFRKVS